jgi:hypothetical protein
MPTDYKKTHICRGRSSAATGFSGQHRLVRVMTRHPRTNGLTSVAPLAADESRWPQVRSVKLAGMSMAYRWQSASSRATVSAYQTESLPALQPACMLVSVTMTGWFAHVTRYPHTTGPATPHRFAPTRSSSRA